ncbi:hypothetical protein BGZ70_001080 [Mortierella alpina]|uniref:Uncharacterized protein n=1 Tax=Mortierella alpina TaxID=64518 RepID=A0A9P6LYG6_MORAP|nr:hypothetical protein BGZ70_001080 [Mortierella alpina]
MTNPVAIVSKKVASMDRPQLQAACTKLGLDATAETEELRQLLQDHCSQEGMTVNNSTLEFREVAVKEEAGDGLQAIEGELRIKEEVVEESAVTTELDRAILTKTEEADVVVKEEEGLQLKEEETIGDKATEDGSIKQEDDSQMDVETKIEDTTVPVIQRKQFWESRTSSTRSALPVSKARAAGKLTQVGSSTTTTSKPGLQKRERPAEDMEADGDVKEEADLGNTLPTPGTVRNLIGKFAGSAISPPGSPVNKRRKVEMSKSPRPATTSVPSIPKYKKVIKIPTTRTAKTKSAYATGATRTTTGTRQRKTTESNVSPPDGASTSPGLSSSTSRRPGAASGVRRDYQPPCHSQEGQYCT